MDEYSIECDECGNNSAIFAYDLPEFCPLCGRRAEAEERREIWNGEDDE